MLRRCAVQIYILFIYLLTYVLFCEWISVVASQPACNDVNQRHQMYVSWAAAASSSNVNGPTSSLSSSAAVPAAAVGSVAAGLHYHPHNGSVYYGIDNASSAMSRLSHSLHGINSHVTPAVAVAGCNSALMGGTGSMYGPRPVMQPVGYRPALFGGDSAVDLSGGGGSLHGMRPAAAASYSRPNGTTGATGNPVAPVADTMSSVHQLQMAGGVCPRCWYADAGRHTGHADPQAQLGHDCCWTRRRYQKQPTNMFDSPVGYC